MSVPLIYRSIQLFKEMLSLAVSSNSPDDFNSPLVAVLGSPLYIMFVGKTLKMFPKTILLLF